MKRAIFSMVGITLGLAAWVITAACSQTTITTPVRSFDRPTDVALVCAEYIPTTNLYNVHNLDDCNPNFIAQTTTDMGALPTTPFLGPDPQYEFLLAMVTQSARGEVALVDTSRDKLVSLQPRLPGFGFLPVGLLPEHIRTTTDGCKAVTSNSDSCDYGVIDVSTMINGAIPLQDMQSTVDQTNVVRRIVAAVPDGKGGARVLPARPGWVEIAPDSVPSIHGFDPGGTPGQCTAGTHKAWVALPNCELVVKLDLDPGSGKCRQPDGTFTVEDPVHPCNPTVEQAIRVTKTGATVVTDLTQLSCPSECAGVGVSDGGASDLAYSAPPDAAPGDMSAPPLFAATQAFPGTLAVDRAGGRIIIGDLYGERIDIIPADTSGNLGVPRHVTLEHGATGVTVVRISPRGYAGQFLYAIARDGSVRVVDLDREVECETNPDPRWSGNGIDLQSQNPPINPLGEARQLGCFPLGLPTTPPRASYALTPGIQLTQGQLPKDIAFVHIEVPPGPITTTLAPPAAAPGLLVGDFAWIISSDGHGTVVNIYDGCPQPNQQDENNETGPYSAICALSSVPLSIEQVAQHYGHPTPMLLDRLAHRLRSGHLRFEKPTTPSDPLGMPRVADEFNPYSVAVPSTSTVVDAGVANTDAGASPNLPGMYQETLPLTITQTLDTAPTRVIKFVDPDRARSEVWSVAWEGLLPGTQRALGQWLPNGYFTDSGGAWCSHGVLAGDKLIYSGCAQDGDCDWTFECVHDPAAPADVLNGMCLPIGGDTLTVDYWSRLCGPLLRGQRKYRIISAKTNQPLPGGIPAPMPGTQPFPIPDMGTVTTQSTDYLKLTEIYEPEYTEQTATCTVDTDCANVVVQPNGGLAGSLATRCLKDFDGVNRCLLGCDPAKGDDEGATQPRCGVDFQCATSTQGDLRCMRSPLDDTLFAHCFLELQSYEIHAGDAFIVDGVTSGMTFDESPDATGECTLAQGTTAYSRLRQSRVPLTPTNMCALASPLDSLDTTQAQTNVCLVPPAAGQLSQSEVIHFENASFNIAVTIPVDSNNRPIIPPDGTAVGFNLTGGGNFLSAPLGVDVQAADPTFVLVGPDQQTVYVVDGGKSAVASGLRGQLLRLFTPTQTIDHLFVIR